MDFIYNKIISGREAYDYSKTRSAWAIANIEQGIGWPDEILVIKFREKDLLILPEDDTLLPCIATKIDGPNASEEGIKLITHYLSSLTWVEGRPIKVKEWTSGSPHPFRMAKNATIRLISGSVDHKYFPDPVEPNKRLALALYREALSLDHTAYSFLSYYKIINLKFPNSSDQKKWMEKNIDNIYDSFALQRKEELSSEVSSIPEYLYVSCRCAIAHAGIEPTVDPENTDDILRLNKDLPLIKNFSELLIENEFDIKSSRTIHKEHLYELYGFKNIFANDLITSLKNLDDVPTKTIEVSLNISLRIKSKKEYSHFEGLAITQAVANGKDGQIHMTCVSEDSLVHLILHLDFANEHLKHDIINECNIYDNGEEVSAKYSADYYRFLSDLYLNGHLTIWNSDTEECLSQCNAFIPVNIDMERTIQNFSNLEEKWKAEAEKRSNKENP